MTVALYGTKLGMTRIYDGDQAIPVTVVQCLPNDVVEVKTAEKHGYSALRVACGPKKRFAAHTRPVAEEYRKTDIAPRRFMREIPFIDGTEVGHRVTVEVLKEGQECDVMGRSKGRGFAGVIKRHHFKGFPASHGHAGMRYPGSIGARMDPGKVHKNKKMAGHYGDEQVTVRNLSVVKIDADEHLVLIRGSVPGSIGGLVRIRQQG